MMSPETLSFFAHIIEKETGIIYQDINLYQLKTRLEEIMKTEGFEKIEDLEKIFKSASLPLLLKRKFLDHATNNETLFFRDPTFFNALQNFVLTEILLENPKQIKIWSAASSTGQEAISTAIALDELSKKMTIPPFSIVATDISEKALAKAQAGIYSDFEISRGLSPERKANYFSKVEGGWKINPEISSKINYGYNNLINSAVYGPFHIILCRNVLIYHKVETKKIVLDSLFSQLDSDGAILMGVGETMLGLRDKVSTRVIGNVTFYKKQSLTDSKAS
ncbi:MAG: hypothetical protein COW01_00350 [Bdellovibrionales bacterium CG12_big_fil_rev_8_21_14_0_65_38_15]|nr:MAG: hypothetical protein COW79_09880 [Bdellovibrionales bacterium CG22_combo_CG10-13_8_21_14_all_38_13]PIQ57418.1 MAG: hypothetical protein COW01_00350 [Bdellovibrionales bacterium CG12_big_fil_rev_8_21_14_0_65_38_15]PIR31138.1 MAG: hypothetical protein COV38_01830 [Bdellovibrionales bacterium CG11_big_fil_rev_8_21_14_0_20_38_13]